VIMKRLVLLFWLGILPLLAIQVTGTQSGTWSVANNPYEVTGDITIPEGQFLMIDAGVEVVVNGNFQITVQGNLVVNGTESDSVSFDRGAAVSSTWKGIRLENEAMNSTFEYCIIQHAENGINSINSPFTIHKSRLNLNTKAINLYGIGSDNPSTVLIQDCILSNSVNNAVLISQNSNTTIQGCDIFGNGTGTQFMAAIQLSNQSVSGNCSPIIMNNHIHHNLKQAITAWDVVALGTIYPHIENNQIENNYTGIYLLHAGGLIKNNQIRNNFIPGNSNSGAGLMLSGTRTTPFITGNIVTGNYTGFYIGENASPCLGDMSVDNPGGAGMNQIYDNIDGSGVSHSIYVYNTASNPWVAGSVIKAENNYWGTTDLDVLATSINDNVDNSVLATVDFDPILVESEQASISGIITYTGTNDLSAIYVFVTNAVTNELASFAEVDEAGNYTSLIEEPGDYYVMAIGILNDSPVAYGVLGSVGSPTNLAVGSGQHLVNCDFSLIDGMPPIQLHVGTPTELEGHAVYPLSTKYMFVSTGGQDLIYRDGDFLRLYGTYNEDSMETFRPNENNIWLKVSNVQPGDFWTRPEFDEDTNTFTYKTALVMTPEVVLNEGVEELMYPIKVTSDNSTEEEIWWFTLGKGLVQMTYINNYFTEGLMTYSGFEIIGEDHSLFPLAEGNKWFLLEEEAPFNPYQLHYRVEGADVVLSWLPPRNNGNNWTNYKIFRDGEEYRTVAYSSYETIVPLDATPHTYYVKAITSEVMSESSNTITVSQVGNDDAVSAMMPKLELYPNPFSYRNGGSMNIKLSVPEKSDVQVNVYNVKGQLMVSKKEFGVKGMINLSWDGKDNKGNAIANGVYFVKSQIGKKTQIKKCLVLK